MTVGLGLCPVGLTPVGYGVPYTINSTAAKLFLDPNGVRQNAALINPVTGDVVRGPDGVHLGMSAISQQVYLALRTTRNSIPVKNWGFGFKTPIINETTTNKLQEAVYLALAPLTNRGLIRVDAVDVRRAKSNALSVQVQWTDVSTGDPNTITFDPTAT